MNYFEYSKGLILLFFPRNRFLDISRIFDWRNSYFFSGIDSMSLSNMIRQMPKSLEYLKNDMEGIIFEGHSKVGDNTWINMVAMLTGKLVQSTKQFKTELDDSTYDRFFDDWAHYVWKNFSAAGYRTFFAEDRAE